MYEKQGISDVSSILLEARCFSWTQYVRTGHKDQQLLVPP